MLFVDRPFTFDNVELENITFAIDAKDVIRLVVVEFVAN